MSVASFISYLALERKFSPHTVNAYTSDLAEFHAFYLGQHGVDATEDVNYGSIRSWIVFLVEHQLSNRSVNRKIASLKAYFKFLVQVERIDVSPLATHKALKTPKKVEIPFSEKEMDQVLLQFQFEDTFEGQRDKMLIELLYTSGIRRSELINLKLKDLNFHGKTLKVLGKRNKERVIPLLSQTCEHLADYLKSREEVVKCQAESFVFISKSGHKMYETLVYRIINRYFSKVSSKVKKSPHILRHTFATHLLSNGADLNSVKELLGHSSLASTQVYTHNSIAELKKAHRAAHPRSRE